jgi:septum site-determining protein MinD
MGKTIGILSLKGGVGKTSSAVALADAISKFGKKVLVVDANFSAPNLGLHLNVINPEVTLHHVLSRKARIIDSIQNVGSFDIIPSSMFEKFEISPLRLKEHLSAIKRDYDYIILDSSPALNEETLASMFASDEILIVTTPDYPTLGTTLKAIKIAKQRGTPINGLILNKVHNRNFEISLADIEKTAEVPVMAVIPHDVNVLRALANFTPSTSFSPKSEGSHEYMKLAATLIGEKYNPFRFRDLFRVNPKVQEINREIFYESVF